MTNTIPAVWATLIITASLFLAANIQPSSADEHETSSVSALAERVHALEELTARQAIRIDALEQQISRLFPRPSTPAVRHGRSPKPEQREPVRQEVKTEPAKPTLRWTDPANWKLIEEGMSAAKVKDLLGPAVKVDEWGSYTYWYYRGDESPLTGHVSFQNGAVHLIASPIF